MKATVKHRVNKEQHVEIGTIAPLDEPFVLVVDPSNLCNMRCKFCPTGNSALIKSTGRYQGKLDFDLFTKIIDDLADFNNPLRVLRLYKEGEPLLNPHFADMVKYALNSGMVNKVDTTSNGLLLNPKLNRKIAEAGLGQINISVNGMSSEQIYHYTGVKVDFDTYVRNIQDLFENNGNCEIFVKSIKENLTDDEQKKFFDIFGNISHRIALENLSPAWPMFKFHEDLKMEFRCGHYGQDVIQRKVCPYIFYMLVINSSGKASTCIGDWPNKQIVGDTRTQSVKEIWHDDKLNQYRIDHLRGKRANSPFCGACEVVVYGTLDNLDPYADDILKRMHQ